MKPSATRNSSSAPSEKKTLIGTREKILLAVIWVIICGSLLVNHFLYSAPGAKVEVSILGADSNQNIVKTFDLSQDTTFTIMTDPGTDDEPNGTNLLVIQDGKVWISEANCPNQDCVKMGKISMNGELLVCLPHKVTVSIVGE